MPADKGYTVMRISHDKKGKSLPLIVRGEKWYICCIPGLKASDLVVAPSLGAEYPNTNPKNTKEAEPSCDSIAEPVPADKRKSEDKWCPQVGYERRDIRDATIGTSHTGYLCCKVHEVTNTEGYGCSVKIGSDPKLDAHPTHNWVGSNGVQDCIAFLRPRCRLHYVPRLTFPKADSCHANGQKPAETDSFTTPEAEGYDIPYSVPGATKVASGQGAPNEGPVFLCCDFMTARAPNSCSIAKTSWGNIKKEENVPPEQSSGIVMIPCKSVMDHKTMKKMVR